MTDAEQIAAFIAARGVTRVAVGERTISDREFYEHRGDVGRISRERLDTDALICQRRVTYDAAGRAWMTNGLGEAISRPE